jgi:ubiquinone/menaquinone biosynthesis C-methylase UbiE
MVEHVDYGDRELESLQYDGTWANVVQRFAAYELVNPKFDFVKFALGELALAGNERMLDIGCSGGKMISGLKNGDTIGQGINERPHKHGGALYGIDPDKHGLVNGKSFLFNDSEGVLLSAAYGEELPFANDSFDVTKAFFMLYHSANIDLCLDEMQRVTTNGGKILITTSGRDNKLRHRDFERKIADYLGCDPPPIFAESFFSQEAKVILSQRFGSDNVEHIPHRGKIVIHKGNLDELESYIMSLNSMKKSFSNKFISGDEWQEAIEQVVLPVILEEQKQNGKFEDIAQRDIFICKNIK